MNDGIDRRVHAFVLGVINMLLILIYLMLINIYEVIK
jgi:hypothetical protein